MFKFKDLYVNLAPEHAQVAPETPAHALPEMPAPGGLAGAPWGLLAVWGGGWPVEADKNAPAPFNPIVCGPGSPSQSTLVCDPIFLNRALQLLGGGANGAPIALKDYVKSALDKAAQEPKDMHDMGELEQLEDKLKGALKEVLDRKAEVKSKAAAAAK